MPDRQDEAMERARAAIQGADSVLVLTGAGISAESGVPTFRGEGGLWRGYDATQLATPQAFARDPKLVWEWYGWRRQICNEAQPNPAHRALVELEQRCPEFLLLTQNVDGLHARAGSRTLVELHGNIDSARCTSCGEVFALPPGPTAALPECPRCSNLARPHILWFGETYWDGVLDQALAAARRCQVCLVVGTSAQVSVPAQLATAAQQWGATLIDLNLNPSPLSHQADIALRGPAGTVLPALTRRTP